MEGEIVNKIEEQSEQMDNNVRIEEKFEGQKESKSEEKDSVICEYCSKQFSSQSNLRNHVNSVHSDVRFSCPHCDKIFKTRYGVKIHLRSHTGERPYVCSHCGKTFADDSSRIQHEKYTHTGSVVICNECGKTFKHPRNLKFHMVLHNQGTEYDGTKKMHYSNELKVEALKLVSEIGTAETSRRLNVPYGAIRNWMAACKEKYPCEVCGKGFHSLQRLRDHENRVCKASNFNNVANAAVGQMVLSGKSARGNRFTAEFKREVVEFAQSHSNREACAKYNLGESTVRGWMKTWLDPLECHLCSRKCSYQAQLDRHIEEVHKQTIISRSTAPKQETLKSFMENDGIDARELADRFVLKPDIPVPEKVVTYDPNQRPSPRKKLDDNGEPIKKKAKTKKNNKKFYEIDMNNSFKIEDVKEEIDTIKDEPISDEEFEIPYNVKSEEDIEMFCNPQIETEDGGDYQIDEDDVNTTQETNDDNEASSDEDEGLAGNFEMSMKTEGEGIPADYDKVMEDVKALAPQDLEMMRNILSLGSAEGTSKDETKASIPTASEIKEEFDSDGSGDSESEFEPKVEIHSDDERKPDLDFSVKKKIQKKKASNNRGWRNRVVPNNDIVLDLSKYGLDENSNEFVIMSKYLSDDDFVSGLHAKKYRGKTKSYQCSTCDKKYNTLCDMKRHLVVHKEERSYQCEHCPSMFKLKQSLMRHTTIFHDPTWKGFKCSFCGKQFRDVSSGKMHEAKHIENKRYQCSDCGLSYSDKQSLKSHIAVIHEGQSRYKHTCSLCGKRFVKSHQYKIHMKIHDGSLVISCDICGMTFQQMEYLKNHQRIHDGTFQKNVKVVTYNCDLCEKSYKCKKALQNHVRIIHEGINDLFECSYCHKRFGRKSTLDTHVLLHTGEFKMHNCDFCSASFKDKRNLIKHKEKHNHNPMKVEENR